VVLNFSPDEVAYTLPDGVKAGAIQVSNLAATAKSDSELKLAAWDARVYRVK
jgi:hypothetical protein